MSTSNEFFRAALELERRGHFQQALAAYDRAQPLMADTPYLYYNRANILSLLGRHAEALKDYERSIALKPDNPLAHFAQGNELSALGRHDAALASYEHAILLKPDYWEVYANRGTVLEKLNRLDEALLSYEQAVALKPDAAELYNNHAWLLMKLNRHAEALVAYDHAIALKPAYAEAYNGRGAALEKLRRDNEALVSYDRALALKPDYAEAHNNRGLALQTLGRLEEALAAHEHAIALKPAYAEARQNHGRALQRLGRLEEALAAHERAIALKPEYAIAQFSKAWLQLQLGDYANGFALYEWRLRGGVAHKTREFTQARWQGERLAAGVTLLLHAEQGLGDSIQMLRYLPLVKAKVAQIMLELPKSLHPILGGLAEGLSVVESGSALARFDLHCPLMSLPFIFGTRLDNIPAQMPYLNAPAARLPIWNDRLAKLATPRVGLVWSTSLNPYIHDRGIALERLAPLLELAGCSFVSLQLEYREHDLPALSRLPIARIDDAISDFGDTAAAIEQCDLVISVDTAVAHLAGALGKPLWLLLPFIADWRWLLDRNDSPWYPTARLFRQRRRGDWDGVIAKVAEELLAWRGGLG